MNEVVEVRMASWKAWVQERSATAYPSKNGAQQTMSVITVILSPQAAAQYSAGCGRQRP